MNHRPAVREHRRARDPFYWLDTLWQDARFACRLLARTRWTTLTMVATLTIGIGLNVTVFTLLNAVLMRPWVRTAPETFVRIIPQYSGSYDLRFSDSASMSQPDYIRFRDSARSLASLAAYRFFGLTLSGTESGSVRGGLASCNLFDVLGPGPPVAGRYFLPDECATANERPVALVSETLWRGGFAADPLIIGRVIHLNRIPFTVIGVAPAVMLSGSNAGPADDAAVWVPYTMLGTLRPEDEYFADTRAQWLTVVGRRHRSFSLAQVREELRLIAGRAEEEVPGRRTTIIATNGALLQDPEIRPRAPLIFAVTLGTTGLLLVLVCLNVTTMLLTRSAARTHEVAVRLAIGAGRGRLLRQFLTESLLLTGSAAALSLVIAARLPALIWQSLMSRPAFFDVRPDWRVLLYCAGIATVVGVFAGMSPAIESLRPQLSASLKSSSTTLTPGRQRSRLRGGLVAIQIAVTLVLVVYVSFFVRAQRRFFTYDPGFETRHVLSAALISVGAGFTPPPSFYASLEARIATLPGVVRTGFASMAPWSGRNSTALKEIDGHPLPATRDYRIDPARRLVSSGYFATLGIPLLRGRVFTDAEASGRGGNVPTVISETMARRYWPNQDPIGHRFTISDVHEIVGVCRDVQSVAYMQEDGPFYYAPLDPARSTPPALLVRTSGDPGPVAAAVRSAIRQLDTQMAVTVLPLSTLIEERGERLRPVTIYGGVAGIVALLLALTGVYSVVSFSVSGRIREIGIRIALGASRTEVVSLILRSGVAPVVIGVIAGLGATFALSRMMATVLFGINPR
jgi:predicted permease